MMTHELPIQNTSKMVEHAEIVNISKKISQIDRN